MTQKYAIKESLELVNLVLTMADAIKQAKKDGIVNWLDLPKFAPVVLAAKKAIDGSDLIDEELSELNAEEAQLIASAALNAAQALMESIIKK